MARALLEIRTLARIHSRSAIRTLKEVMAQKTSPPSARVAAASELLDRGWGKAEQVVEISAKIPDAMTDDELNAELARVSKLIDGKTLQLEAADIGSSVLETCRPDDQVIDNKEEP